MFPDTDFQALLWWNLIPIQQLEILVWKMSSAKMPSCPLAPVLPFLSQKDLFEDTTELGIDNTALEKEH